MFRARISFLGVEFVVLLFYLVAFEVVNLGVVWGRKSACVHSKCLLRCKTLFLDKIMSTCCWKIYYVNEVIMWSCSYTTWKLAFQTMFDAMTTCTTSHVFICSLPCAHCNKWMFTNQLMECVHTQWKRFSINFVYICVEIVYPWVVLNIEDLLKLVMNC